MGTDKTEQTGKVIESMFCRQMESAYRFARLIDKTGFLTGMGNGIGTKGG